MKKIFNLIKKENGQAVVELALTLPILLVVICGIIDIGWMFSNQLTVNNCAREAARYAIVSGSTPNLATMVAQRAKDVAPSSIRDKITVNVTFTNAQNISSGDVVVNVVCNIKALTPFFSRLTQNGMFALQSSDTMKME